MVVLPEDMLAEADLAAAAGSVTSVGLAAPTEFAVAGSPVTAAGTLGLSWVNQGVAVVFAGPASGALAAPTFRLLIANDIPNLDASKITSGTFSDARLSGNVPLKSTANTFTANQVVSGSVTATSFVGAWSRWMCANSSINDAC